MQEMVSRLSQLTVMKREVDDLSQRIGELELAAQGGVGRISGLPGGGQRIDRHPTGRLCSGGHCLPLWTLSAV